MIAFSGTAPITQGFSTEDVVATITLPYTNQSTSKFASIHSNPPGIKTEIPAMLMKNIGKGTVIWSALPIEGIALYDYRRILKSVITDIFGVDLTVKSDAPTDVELTLFDDNGDYLVSAVQFNDEYEARRVADFSIKIKLEKAPKKLLYLPSEECYPFEYDGEYISFNVKSPSILEMYKIVTE